MVSSLRLSLAATLPSFPFRLAFVWICGALRHCSRCPSPSHEAASTLQLIAKFLPRLAPQFAERRLQDQSE